MLTIRPALNADAESIWRVLRPILRAGESYALPRQWGQAEALTYWYSAHHEVFVAEGEEGVNGTYYMRANQLGGGAHAAI